MIGVIVDNIARLQAAPRNANEAHQEAVARFGELGWVWIAADLAGAWFVVGLSCHGIRHELGRGRDWATAFATASATWGRITQ